jgi:hypothetical protein
MLDGMSSRMFSEWVAYERENGPIGSQWRDELLAQMHELQQHFNHMFGAANFTGMYKRARRAAEQKAAASDSEG